MNSQAVSLLAHEHEIISEAGKLISLLEELLADDPEEYGRHAGALLAFLKEYGDGYHHFKEEHILFPALTDQHGIVPEAIIGELNEHHENFREYAESAGAALAAGNYAEAHTVLKRYLSELLDHIAIENDELFIMSENLLSEAEHENLYYRMKDADRELGEERKKEWEGFSAVLGKQLM